MRWTALGTLAVAWNCIAVLSSQSGPQSLCVGSSLAPEKNGVLRALQQIGKLLPAANSDARLVSIDLMAQGVCQYELISPGRRQRLIFVDAQGTIKLANTLAAAGSEHPLPGAFVDLPAATAAAERQGMRLPLDSARLRMAQPRGKPAIAVWTLSPRNDPQGRVLSYFISAADAGHPLAVSDVTDYISDYNAQARRTIDLFRPTAAGQPGSSQPAKSPILHQPCTCWDPLGWDPVQGVWEVNMSFTGITCQLHSFVTPLPRTCE